MCSTEIQARQVSDFVAQITVTIIMAGADGVYDPPEIAAIINLAEAGADTFAPMAEEVATSMEVIKSIINAGPMAHLHPVTQGKIVSIAEGRIRREERQRQKEKAARSGELRAASGQ